jgi:hypothetical protein
LNFQVIEKTISALHREGTQRPKIGPSKRNRNGIGSIDAIRNRTRDAPPDKGSIVLAASPIASQQSLQIRLRIEVRQPTGLTLQAIDEAPISCRM